MTGGFIGAPRIPSTVAAAGCFTANEHAYYQQQTGNVLRWPNASDASFSSVSLLCHFDEWNTAADTLKNYGTGTQVTALATSVSSFHVKFRQLSGYIPVSATTPSWNAASDAAFNYGSGDFTIEFWLYPTANTGGVIWDQRPAGTNGFYPTLYFVSTGNVEFYTNSGSRITATGGLVTTGAWHHVALSKTSGSTKLFINGTQTGSTYTDANTYLTSPITIGGNGFAVGNASTGYYQEARATKGVGRYTANFTAPTAPFPDY